MTEFEQQVADALRGPIMECRDTGEALMNGFACLPEMLAPRVAAAIERLAEELGDVADKDGNLRIGDWIAHDATDARHAAYEMALAALRGKP